MPRKRSRALYQLGTYYQHGEPCTRRYFNVTGNIDLIVHEYETMYHVSHCVSCGCATSFLPLIP